MAHEIASTQTVVTVCICTFRRASLTSTLSSVVNQTLPDNVKYRILVVDNDITPTAEAPVTHFRVSNPNIDLRYVHAPSQNISVARNAALNECDTRWLAFIDDDETAAPNWLERLTINRNAGVAIFGLSKAVYGPATPDWIKLGDYHSNQPQPRRGIVDTGYTSNALIDMSFVRKHNLHFDEALGRTGAEDTDFFYAMHRLGGRLVYTPDAVVYEEVADNRRTLRWVARRRQRVGQTYAKLQQRYDTRAYNLIPILSPIKIVFCIGMAALLAIRPDHAMWWLMRGVFHWGTLSYRISGKVYEEY
jgi:succinoglycan biosynthesis protein ExoM